MSHPVELKLTASGRGKVATELNAAAAEVRRFHKTVETESSKSIRSNAGLVQAFRGLNNATSGLPGRFVQVAQGLAQIGQAGGSVKIAAAGVVGLAAVAATAVAVMTVRAFAFDKAMRNVNSITGQSETAFRATEAAVIDLSKRLPQSATTLAQGLYDIASSGFQGADGMKILTAAATAASAGLTTTEVSARAITSVLNSYGLSASSAADVSDVLFQTVNLGVISFDELANNLGDIVGIAATAKISIAQVGSAIATMTLSGLNGALAANSLQNLLQKTIKPSAALAAEFKNLGYQSGAQALQADGLRGVMDKLRVATGGNIEALLKLYPDIQAARGALALMANSGRNYAKVANQIEDADKRRGATQRTLNEQMKSASNQLAIMRNKLDAVAITGGTRLLPVLIALLGGLNKLGSQAGREVLRLAQALAPAWSDLSGVGHDLVSVLHDTAQTLGPVALGFAKLGVGAAVVSLNGLAQALHSTSGFLAQHPALVSAAAVAWGVQWVGAMVAARGGVQGLSAAFSAANIQGVLASWEVGFRKSALATNAFGLSIAALIGYGIVSVINDMQKTQHAGQDTAAAIKSVFDTLGTKPNLAGLDAARKALNDIGSDAQAKRPDHGIDQRTGRAIFDANGGAEYNKSLDLVSAAQQKVGKETANLRENLRLLSITTGLSNAGMVKLAEAAGVDLTGSWQDAAQGIAVYRLAQGDTTVQQQSLIKSMGSLADAAGDAGAKVKGLKDSLDALMGPQLGVNEATRSWLGGLKDLTDQLEGVQKATKGHTNTLDLNTVAGRANSEAVDKQSKALSDLVVAQANNGASAATLNATWNNGVAALRRTMSQAGFTRAQIDKYTTSLGLVPGNVNTIVKAAGADSSVAQVAELRRQIALLQNKTVTVQAETIYKTIGSPPGTVHQGRGIQAYGGIYTERYADGGIRPLPKQAMIARNGPALIQWAEPGTGGEAFIPLAPSRRDRSEQILARVADGFGLQVVKAAQGQILTAANGMVTSSPYDPAGLLKTDPGQMTLVSYARSLQWGVIRTQQWRQQLKTIAAVAGDDVAAQLASMGERGVDLVRKMATGTKAQMKQVAAALRQLGPAGDAAISDFQSSLKLGTKAASDFQKNLLTLINRGQTSLASTIAGMGADAGGVLAAQAAHASAGTLTSLSSSLAANTAATDPQLMNALQLAGLLQASGGKLGIAGLATQSGMSVADVYGLLIRYDSKVFSKIGKSMAQVLRDEALVNAGKPISGMRYGGIMPDGANAVRFAERGTGGEAYIPLGATNRYRSREIWKRTGRMLGMGVGGGGVTVAPGAVAVSITVPPGLSESSAVRIAQGAVDQAMSALVRELKTGTR